VKWKTAHACRMAGFSTVDIVTVWELVSGDASLDSYDFLCLPGGFLDGDDLGSAKAQAKPPAPYAGKKNRPSPVRAVFLIHPERQAHARHLATGSSSW